MEMELKIAVKMGMEMEVKRGVVGRMKHDGFLDLVPVIGKSRF